MSKDILIVDDIPANLHLLVRMLMRRGYKVRPTSSGKMALAAAQAKPPDLILLDVMMPKMDGYEVCHLLKADERTRDVPVIFISAMSETLDKVKAFSAGGVDYITKPFQDEEVILRIETHLTIRSLQKSHLEQIVELNAFAHTVAHDLKSSLSTMIGFSQLLIEYFPQYKEEQVIEFLKSIEQVGKKGVKIINEILLLSSVRSEEIHITEVDMSDIISEVQERLCVMIEQYQAEIIYQKSWPVAVGYAPWIEEIWANYLTNGMKYGGTTPRLELGADIQEDEMIRFWIRDSGSGIAKEDISLLFTEFTRLGDIDVEGTGLGLSIVRRIVERLKGTVGVESVVGQGTLFYFTLPPANDSTSIEQ